MKMWTDGPRASTWIWQRKPLRAWGMSAVFSVIDWEAKKELVESGEIDCIWGSFSIDGREDQYRWSAPYMVSRQVVAVRSDSDIYTLADLAGRRVAVQIHDQAGGYLPFARRPEASGGGRDVFDAEPGIDVSVPKQRAMWTRSPRMKRQFCSAWRITGLEYRILDEPLLTVGLGVAFALDDERAGWNRRFPTIFEEMRADGTMEEIIGRYLDEPLRYMEGKSDEGEIKS